MRGLTQGEAPTSRSHPATVLCGWRFQADYLPGGTLSNCVVYCLDRRGARKMATESCVVVVLHQICAQSYVYGLGQLNEWSSTVSGFHKL
jgi:hypothetical protein